MRKYWDKLEIDRLIKVYPFNSNKKIAYYFRRSESSIQNMAIKLRLKKDPAYDNPGSFKKGQEPFNKGKRHIHNSKTKFKPGNVPPQARDEEIIISIIDGRPYKRVKVDYGRKRDFLHKIKWIDKYGPIPKGYILRCKGDTLNESPDNWELISRAENLRRNHNREKFSQSMKKRWERKRTMKKYFSWL